MFNKWQTKHSVLAVVLICLLCLTLFVGCSQQGSESKPADVSQEPTDEYPNRPIEIIVSFGPGGINDQGARYVAPVLSKVLGVPVNVRNMPGHSGRLGREYVFNAPPDGYTLLQTGAPSTAIGELLQEGLYKTLEFEYIGNFWGGDYRVVIVPADSPYKTWNDLYEASKTKKLVAASSSGYGSTAHLQSLILETVAGLKHEYVPFESDAEVAEMIMGGQADFGIVAGLPVLAMAESGRIRVVAVHGTARMDGLPDVPTFDELGVEGAVLATTTGLLAPPGTPQERVEILRETFKEAVESQEFKDLAEKAGLVIELQIGDEFYNSMKKAYEMIQEKKDILLGGTKK